MTMKVHELITKLQQYPADTAIKIGIDRICYPEVGLVDVEYLTEDPNIYDEDREIEAEAVACGSMALEDGTEYPRVLSGSRTPSKDQPAAPATTGAPHLAHKEDHMDTNGNNGRAAFVTAGTLLISAGKIVTLADIMTTDAEPAVAMVEAANTGASEPPEDLLDAMVASGCRRSVLLFNTDHDFKRRVMRKVAEVFGARTDVPLAERVEAYAVALQAETGQPVERLDHPQWPPQIVRRLMEHVAGIEMGEPDEGGKA